MYSIVVATFNRAHTLDETLRSLLAQEAEVPYEVVVVDNNSSDSTRSVVQAFEETAPHKVRYVFEGQQGLSVARNTGITAARGEIIAFVDDDVIAQPHWLNSVNETFRAHPDAWCVGGKVMLRLPEPIPPWFEPGDGIMTIYLSSLDYGDDTIKIEYPGAVVGTNFSVKGDALRRVGVFDPRLGRFGSRLLSGEETDLFRRIQRAGGGVYYCGRAVVIHLVPLSRMTKRFFRNRAYWQGRTAGRVIAKRGGIPSLRELGSEGVVMTKDWVKAFVHYGIGNRRRAFEHELAALKRLGYLQQTYLVQRGPAEAVHGQSLRMCTDPVTLWLHRLMEAVAPDVSREVAGKGCLVLAPHPDDEVLGCGGTIAQMVQQGVHVSIAYLTDGRQGVAALVADARALREAEAVQAAAALGLPPDRLTFFRFEDGRLADHIAQATAGIRQMLASLDVDALFVPYRREYHADHRAAWQIGQACRRDGMRVYEYPIWYGPWLWRRLGWQARLATALHLVDALSAVKVSIAEVADIKQRALGAYRSQLSGFEREGPWGTEYLANFSGRYELFFAAR